jgi:hypothetical protein
MTSGFVSETRWRWGAGPEIGRVAGGGERNRRWSLRPLLDFIFWATTKTKKEKGFVFLFVFKKGFNN